MWPASALTTLLVPLFASVPSFPFDPFPSPTRNEIGEMLARLVLKEKQMDGTLVSTLSLSFSLLRTEEYAHKATREHMRRGTPTPWHVAALMCELFAAIACLPPALSGFNSRYYRIRGPPPRCPDPCGRGTSLSPQTNRKLASFLNIAGLLRIHKVTPRTKAGLIDHA